MGFQKRYKMAKIILKKKKTKLEDLYFPITKLTMKPSGIRLDIQMNGIKMIMQKQMYTLMVN